MIPPSDQYAADKYAQKMAASGGPMPGRVDQVDPIRMKLMNLTRQVIGTGRILKTIEEGEQIEKAEAIGLAAEATPDRPIEALLSEIHSMVDMATQMVLENNERLLHLKHLMARNL